MPEDTDGMMIARSMGWMQRHDGLSAAHAGGSSSSLPPLKWGFEDLSPSPHESALPPQEQMLLRWGFEGIDASPSKSPQPLTESLPPQDRPPLHWGFEEVPAGKSPLPLPQMPPLPSDSLPPLKWGFEDTSPSPQPQQESLPPLTWGFQEVDEPTLALDCGFQNSPPANSAPPHPALVWGFEGLDEPPAAASDVEMKSLPPLDLGFQGSVEEDDTARDEALPPVIQEPHGDQLPPLDLEFREIMLDVVNRAYNLMESAINKLDELDVEENPARDQVRNQIQRCKQTQALYKHMALHRISTRALIRTLCMVLVAGPQGRE